MLHQGATRCFLIFRPGLRAENPSGKKYSKQHRTGQIRLPAFLRSELHLSCLVRARTAGLGLWLPTALRDDRQGCGVRGQRRDKKEPKKMAQDGEDEAGGEAE